MWCDERSSSYVSFKLISFRLVLVVCGPPAVKHGGDVWRESEMVRFYALHLSTDCFD